MTIAIGEMLTATIYVADDSGDPIEGLFPTTVASTDPLGADFGVTYEDAGDGAYHIVSDQAAMRVGTYTIIVDANDSVIPGDSQIFSVTWDTDGESVVITGVQRVQYVMVPHPADPDGTHDTRYYTKAEGESSLGSLVDSKADITYVDAELALKADQSEVDALATDLGAVLIDTDDMATITYVDAGLAGKAATSHNHDATYYTETEANALLAAKVGDFTQWYTQTIILGNGTDTITTSEPSVQFSVPEEMTLHSAELWSDATGDITLSTSRAAAGSATFSLIHGAAPLALVADNVATPPLTGWTTAMAQFDKVRTTVSVSAVTLTRCWVCYRFSKARGMSHTVQGNVTSGVYSTTQDKTLTLTSRVVSGSVLVAICAGYGTDGTIDLTSITDSEANTWDVVKISGASPSRFVMLGWTRIASAMTTSDTVTFNMTGSFTRSYAIVRAYQGLGSTEMDVDEALGSGNPAQTPAVAYSGAGRAISVALYTSDNFATNFWANGFSQTVNYNSAANFDTITVGERTVSGSGSVVPRCNATITASWGIVSLVLPEQSLGGVRNQQTGMM